MRIQPLILASITTTLLIACGREAEPVVGPPAVSQSIKLLTDAEVTTKVNHALAGETDQQGRPIDVVTSKGDVRLIAVLRSQQQLDQVVATVHAVDGVHSIHNELSVGS